MRTRHKLTLFLLHDFPILLLLRQRTQRMCRKLCERESWQKRQVLNFPFLPGRIAGGPGKGRRLLMAERPRDLALAAGKGASINLLIRGEKLAG
uniref:Uncharacterized protein n=1 Tax=Neovison vison TaxID=452646 RepID=A0A8C7B3R4_NEOVI